MTNLDRFNPIGREHVEERDRFDALSSEDQKKEINRLHEGALIENCESFYILKEKENSQEEKEDLDLAIKVCEAIRDEGGAALVVGGFARDAAMAKFGYNLKPKDIDIEVYGIEPEKLKEILEKFGKIELVGEQFLVIKLKGLDISIPRRESKTGKGHKGFDIQGDPTMLVKEAAQRRDFTINTLALDPLTGEILDFYGGVDDIKNKVLRMTDEKTFVDDSLRVLRAAQFAARFGMMIDPETVEVCRSLDLNDLPKERIGEEWEKLLMRSDKPSIGMEAAKDLKIIEKLHPELAALQGVPQRVEYHPEGDVWQHTKLVVDSAVQVARENNLSDDEKLILVLAALCHDLGKATATQVLEDGRITAHGHEDAGLPLSQSFLESLKIKHDIIDRVKLLVADHMFIHNTDDPTDVAIRRLARRLYPATIKELAYLATADVRGSTRFKEGEKYPEAEEILKKAQELAVGDSKPVALIMGRDLLQLGFKQGKKVGEILKEIEELQIEGKIMDSEAARDYARLKLHTMELQSYGLPGLEGRIQRGLDPAGMLAVSETRKLVEDILTKLGIKIEDVDKLTRELHVGAVWNKAEDLAWAEKPEVRIWMLLIEECRETNDKDLNWQEYLMDFERIKKDLEAALENPEQAVESAAKKMVEEAKHKFIIKDGVPFSEEDAFIYMAIAGERYGVCKAGELYFVGADELDYSVLENEGFVATEKEGRERMATFYQKDGKDIVKKLYPGLAIVFGDEDLALRLAKTASK